MITIKFTDGEVQIGNPKKTRAWLRKNGLTIRNGRKEGNTWIFDCEKPGGAPQPKVFKGLDHPIPETQVLKTYNEGGKVVNVDAVLQRQSVETLTSPVTYHLPTKGIPIKGIDLLPGDSIMDFISGKHLTIDDRGVHEIIIPAPNITRQENRFLGFYSLESRGMSSYKIDPEKRYDVIR